MVAPGVLSAMETLSEEAKLVPLAGVMLGEAAPASIGARVYLAELTALTAKLLAMAMALMVVEAVIVIGPE
jgi:hypothetical protein